jgi:hypothetical protein
MRLPNLLSVLAAPLLIARAEVSLEFREAFADPATREHALTLLVPGSPEAYFHTALHQQLKGDAEGVAKTITAFRQRHPDHPLAEQIAFRQTLLDYAKNPKATTDDLIRRFGLFFDHAPDTEDPGATAPNRLAPDFTDPARLLEIALRSGNLSAVKDEGLYQLTAAQLNPGLRRELLGRIDDPTYPGLLDLVAADLQHENSGGFGSLKAHGGLTLAQLEQLAQKIPALLENSAYIDARIARLAPGADDNADLDRAVRRAWLERLHAFTSGLGPAFNNLKAGVIYDLLDLDRSEGKTNLALFIEYLKIPRDVPWLHPAVRKATPHQQLVRLSNDIHPGGLPPPRPGEPLVLDLLRHFLAEAATPEAFAPYFEERWLRAAHATARILAGQGNPESFASALTPGEFAALRDRVDIDFLPSNPRLFAPDQPVTLAVDVKNVASLLVKVYEINLVNYCRENLVRPGLDLDLDGLAATREFTVEYKETPFRRVTRSLEFPELQGRGAWIVELIGNGRSSRALIQKGRLEMASTMTPDCHEIRVFDETGATQAAAAVWFGGKEYTAGADGVILLPYSTDAGEKPLMLKLGGFADVRTLDHQTETWSLGAGLYVDREDLLPGRQARLVVRPVLNINDLPASIALLDEPRLVITARMREGTTTTEEIPGVKLEDGAEFVHLFRVPDGLAGLQVMLKGKVKPSTRAEPDELEDGNSWTVNTLAMQPRCAAPRFTHDADGYALEIRGLNGEVMPARAAEVTLLHRAVDTAEPVTLASDANGRISLGGLPGVVAVRVNFDGGQWIFELPESTVHTPALLHGVAGEPLRIALPDRARPVLLSRRGDLNVADLGQSVQVDGGVATLKDLPAGDYEFIPAIGAYPVTIRIAAGKPVDGRVFSKSRMLDLPSEQPLHISSVKEADGGLVITLAHPTPETRVHVAAARHAGGFDLGGAMGYPAVAGLGGFGFSHADSRYTSGRELGDEYRYMLDRRTRKAFPGVMLPKPGLILNPWDRAATEAGREKLAAGEELADMAGLAEGRAFGGSINGLRAKAGGMPENYDFLDFLAEPAVVLTNLKPAADGTVRVKVADLGGRPVVQIVAVSLDQVVARTHFAPATPPKTRDLRLAKAFPDDKLLAEQKVVSALAKGDTIQLPLAAGNDLQIIDGLGKMFDYLQALRKDDTLDQYRFILGWGALPEKEKLALYSKHACHELAFFVYRQDRAFFDRVLRPYLANKRDKTFLDRWMLDEDLTRYLDPWAFARLNTVEQILLAERLPEAREGIVRRIADQVELLPKDREEWNRRFDSALTVGGLATGKDFANFFATGDVDGDDFGFGAALGNAAPAPDATPAPAAEAMPMEIAEALSERSLDAKKPESRARPARPARRKMEEAAKRLYQKPDDTKEWAENNYRNLLPGQQDAALVGPSAFWLEFARRDAQKPFLSENLGQPSRNFTEAMLALAVTGLPFKADPAKVESDGRVLTVTAGGPCVVFRKEIRESTRADGAGAVVMSRQFFDPADATRLEDGEQVEKYLTAGFVRQRVYGARAVVSNPTGRARRLTVLLQIPEGAIPVSNGFQQRGVVADVAPFGVWQAEYFFTFPAAGTFRQAPALAAEKDRIVAAGEPFTFAVLEKPEGVDTTAWPHVSQRGSADEVLAFLSTRNLQDIDLERIAFRMKDKGFFARATAILRARRAFHPVLWAYGFQHGDEAAMREWLSVSDAPGRVGVVFDSPLLQVDPVERLAYEQLEYAPLINPRAHPVGGKLDILNAKFKAQYEAFLGTLAGKAALEARDLLAWSAYLLAQDRVADAAARFAAVDRARITEQMQADFLHVHLLLHQGDIAGAEKIARAHADEPVDRWREKFAAALAQIAEAGGAAPVKGAEDRPDNQAAASTEPALSLAAVKSELEITHRLLDSCRVNVYPMDVELLFSKKPFLRDYSAGFSFVRPVRSDVVELKGKASPLKVPVPAEFAGRNVAIEIESAGLRSVITRLDSALTVEKVETYGEVRVLGPGGKPVPAAYVKVFARQGDGSVVFHKDGHTDLRGRFDYASVNGEAMDKASAFAILVLSDEHGAVILEAAPPKR